MKLTIFHETRYQYPAEIRHLVQSLRLTPSKFQGQTVKSWQIEVQGGTRGGAFRDGAGDWIEGWSVRGPASEAIVTVRGEIETHDQSGVLRGHRETITPTAYLRETEMTKMDAGLKKLAKSAGDADSELDLAHKLSGLVSDAVPFHAGVTNTTTTAAEALKIGGGVCQDHSQVLAAVARHRGLPARYVSGYLHSTADGSLHEAAHAWAEIYIDGLGWVGFDAANRTCPDERYVRLASGLDSLDAAPIRGTAQGAAASDLNVTVQVQESQQ